MRLTVNGKMFDTSALKRRAYTRYRAPERLTANSVNGQSPDDVHTWDNLYQTEDGAFVLYRRERVQFPERLFYTDQAIEMTPEDVVTWYAEVEPPYFDDDFVTWMKRVSAK